MRSPPLNNRREKKKLAPSVKKGSNRHRMGSYGIRKGIREQVYHTRRNLSRGDKQKSDAPRAWISGKIILQNIGDVYGGEGEQQLGKTVGLHLQPLGEAFALVGMTQENMP